MPTITDWLMVGITAIYVIATIAIFKANNESATIAKDQLNETKKQLIESKSQFEKQLSEMKAQLYESKRQYEESRRLDCFPFLQLEKVEKTKNPLQIVLPNSFRDSNGIIFEESHDVKFKLKNVGNGTAINLMYIWETELENEKDYSLPDISAIMEKDYYDIIITIPAYYSATGFLIWDFDDLLGNHYSQKVFISFKDGMLYQFDNDMPMYKNKSF